MMVLERTRHRRTSNFRSNSAATMNISSQGLWVAILGLIIGMGISLAFIFVQSEFELIGFLRKIIICRLLSFPTLIRFSSCALSNHRALHLASWIPARIGAPLITLCH